MVVAIWTTQTTRNSNRSKLSCPYVNISLTYPLYNIQGVGSSWDHQACVKANGVNLLWLGAGRQRALRPSVVSKENYVLFIGMERRQDDLQEKTYWASVVRVLWKSCTLVDIVLEVSNICFWVSADFPNTFTILYPILSPSCRRVCADKPLVLSWGPCRE